MTDANFDGTYDNSAQERSTRSAKSRQQITRAWLMRSRRDATEHAILGSTDLGYAIKHPLKSAAWLSGFAVSGLLAVALIIGGLHLLFGTPGSVRFAWDRPTTWFAAGADVVRAPLVRMLGGTAERLDGDGEAENTSGFDSDAFEE
ncbi:MAG: hypothetical protein F6J95_031020 [Leptolyngbya sp. SIO1E4]|nr:hypothetical protein [Leptolyngbya sp. SIO1E4]